MLRDAQHLNPKHTVFIWYIWLFLLLGDEAHLQSVDFTFENSSRFLVICQINDNIGLYLYIWMCKWFILRFGNWSSCNDCNIILQNVPPPCKSCNETCVQITSGEIHAGYDDRCLCSEPPCNFVIQPQWQSQSALLRLRAEAIDWTNSQPLLSMTHSHFQKKLKK